MMRTVSWLQGQAEQRILHMDDKALSNKFYIARETSQTSCIYLNKLGCQYSVANMIIDRSTMYVGPLFYMDDILLTSQRHVHI